jgi:hypothetical protein
MKGKTPMMTKALSNPKLFAAVAILFSLATFANLAHGAVLPPSNLILDNPGAEVTVVVASLSFNGDTGPTLPPDPDD